MNVVIEGCDAAGKSTLLEAIRARVHWPVQPSEGPPKYPGEMNERVERYAKLDFVLFDRHPCVSQPIYAMIRGSRDDIKAPLIRRFYESKPLFVFCQPDAQGFARHTFNPEADNPEHLAGVQEKYNDLLAAYQAWGLRHANIMYRLGERFDETVELIVRSMI